MNITLIFFGLGFGFLIGEYLDLKKKIKIIEDTLMEGKWQKNKK